MDRNSHRHTDWCPVKMYCFAMNYETPGWSSFRPEIANAGCFEILSMYSALISVQNDLNVGK